MAKLPPIAREDIESWARKSPNPHFVMQLVRRLLWASVPTLRIEPRPLGEWGDAVVLVEHGAAHVPKGRSIWAFDARRWEAFEPGVVAGTSHVLVDPTRSGALRASHPSVRVIGADTLEQWLARRSRTGSRRRPSGCLGP